MRINSQTDLNQLAALMGDGAGPTRARVLRALLIDAGWTDTEQISRELWALYVDMAETAIMLGLGPLAYAQ